MNPKKRVLTTGQVAKICNVAPRTVSKWFDQGHLRGYRIPGSKDRRIPIEHLVKFMRTNGIPMDGLETGAVRVLAVVGDESFKGGLVSGLSSGAGYEVLSATSAFEAGAVFESSKPQVLIVDTESLEIQPDSIIRFLRTSDGTEGVSVVGIVPVGEEGAGEALKQAGFDAYICKPFEITALVRLIEGLMSDVFSE